MALFGSLVVRVLLAAVVVPAPVAVGLLLAGLVVYASLVGAVESGIARFRMHRVPQLLVAASAIAVFGLILLLR